jgi:hypothetical protein
MHFLAKKRKICPIREQDPLKQGLKLTYGHNVSLQTPIREQDGSPLFRVDIITKTNAGKLKKHLIHKE